MQKDDTFAGLIAFLFEQDRREHPPPRDRIGLILKTMDNPQSEHKEKAKWRKI